MWCIRLGKRNSVVNARREELRRLETVVIIANLRSRRQSHSPQTNEKDTMKKTVAIAALLLLTFELIMQLMDERQAKIEAVSRGHLI
jgi:hypothetical protein